MPRIVILIVLLFCLSQSNAQSILSENTVIKDSGLYKIKFKKVIIPGVLISYGVASLLIDDLKTLNQSTRNETREHTKSGFKIDNFMQYIPAAAVYSCNAFGYNGVHSFKERTIIYATSQLILTSIVYPTKKIIAEERPDKSGKTSFPSGHTATAFSSAHFLFREYRDKNFLLSISGYPLATATGIYRIVNDKHWVGDVVAGAGIGILSTESAYWLYPKISKWFTGRKNKQNPVVMIPYYQSGVYGLHIVKNI